MYGKSHAKRISLDSSTGDNPQSIFLLHMHVTRLPKYICIHYNIVVLATAGALLGFLLFFTFLFFREGKVE